MDPRKEAEKLLLKNMPDRVKKLHADAKGHKRQQKRVLWMDAQRRALAADFKS